jgi:predicted Fe-S protein YdhL (DUF1289 family)
LHGSDYRGGIADRAACEIAAIALRLRAGMVLGNLPDAAMTIASPCIKVCTLDPASQLCIGCGRTPAEIAGWMTMSQAERRRVMALLPERLAHLAARDEALP